MTKLVYIPIDKNQFHAYESDVRNCSEIYDMEGVTQINKICHLTEGHESIDEPHYSIERDGKHYLLLDRSEFELQSIEQVLSYCRLWVQTESIEDVIHYNNR